MSWKNKFLQNVLKSYIINFNFCPFAWLFNSCKTLKKIEEIHEYCFRVIRNDYGCDNEIILEISGKSTMNIKNSL